MLLKRIISFSVTVALILLIPLSAFAMVNEKSILANAKELTTNFDQEEIEQSSKTYVKRPAVLKPDVKMEAIEAIECGVVQKEIPKFDKVQETLPEETEIAEMNTEVSEEQIAEESVPEETEMQVVEETIPEETELPQIEETKWEGEVLNKYNGTVQGPSGKETYYNLDMTGVIWIMESLGYDYEYHVREDGVKMYGPYIMCAANLEIRPKGTLVETSLGLAMVCDTGSYAKIDPTWIDIAVTW